MFRRMGQGGKKKPNLKRYKRPKGGRWGHYVLRVGRGKSNPQKLLDVSNVLPWRGKTQRALLTSKGGGGLKTAGLERGGGRKVIRLKKGKWDSSQKRGRGGSDRSKGKTWKRHGKIQKGTMEGVINAGAVPFSRKRGRSHPMRKFHKRAFLKGSRSTQT